MPKLKAKDSRIRFCGCCEPLQILVADESIIFDTLQVYGLT